LGLALSEKQIPQIVETVANSKHRMERMEWLRIPGDGDQRFPNDRDRDSWMIVISVPTEGDQ